MAPPKKQESLKNKYRIPLNFNQLEIDTLKKHQICKNHLLKSIIMQSLSNDKIVIQTNKDPNYIASINKIGVNLNQIAKKLNSIHEISSSDIAKLNSLVDLLRTIITQ